MRTGWLSLVVIVAISIPLVWCFGASWTGDRVFAYRDAAHFYYPLESWVCTCWSRGQWPLWNPQDGTGMPIVADATSAIFYPGKLVLALPLEFAQRYAWYIILHVLIAAAGAYCLARRVGWLGLSASSPPAACGGELTSLDPSHPGACALSRPAAGLCAVAYALSGTVLFQYCNVVFLVGAAWLPWSMFAAHRMLAQRSVRWACVMGMCLALMVLGGDPQSAYHAGLLAVLYAVLRLLAGRAGASVATESQRYRVSRELVRTLSLLAIAGTSGMLLSAVQIVPVWSWLATSDRAVFTGPRSIYEIPSYLRRARADGGAGGEAGPGEAGPGEASPVADPGGWAGVAQGLWGQPPESEHVRRAYGFSVAPWRLLELLWPNVSGRPFPRNHRWLAAIGGEDRVWTPSLYLGVLPLVLGLGAWRLRRADVQVRWLSWTLLLAVLGSFGWYGLGLLIQLVLRSVPGAGPSLTVAEPVGGLYWFMTVCLPGYVHFRYPAKLMVMASLALAVLGGIGLDQLRSAGRARSVRALGRVAIVSLLGVLVVLATRPWWMTGLAGAQPDELYGPLDPGAAWLDALTGCVHAACVSGVGWWLVGNRRVAALRLAPLLLLVTACELAWANGWMVLTAPACAMSEEPVIGAVPGRLSSSTVYRWPSRVWVPRVWRETSSCARVQESVRWDVATLYAKLHLLGPHRSLRPQSSIAPYDLRVLLNTRGGDLPHPAVLDLLGAEYLIVPEDCPPPGPGWTRMGAARRQPGVCVWCNAQAYPRVWIVHEVEAWPAWTSTDPRAIRAYYDSLLFPAGRPRDFRTEAIVESGEPAVLPAVPHPAGPAAAESARVQAEGAGRVEVEVTLAAPGLLVLNQYFDPHWQVEIRSGRADSERGRIVRTNRIMQGVVLPAGTHELVFQYAPWDLYWAGGVSLASWLLAAIGIRSGSRPGSPPRWPRGCGAAGAPS